MSKELPTKETPIDNKIKVDTAILQAAASFPGSGRTESTLNSVKIPGIQMFWLKGEGLLVSVKGKESFIPDTNVKIVHFMK